MKYAFEIGSIAIPSLIKIDLGIQTWDLQTQTAW
jgi:hypothetical protein